MHQLNACQSDRGVPEAFETEHDVRSGLDAAMILLHEIIQILRGSDLRILGQQAVGFCLAHSAVRGRACKTWGGSQGGPLEPLGAALAGCFPADQVASKFELNSLQLSAELPVSLPSRLVQQRLDIRAADAQLHSASALVVSPLRIAYPTSRSPAPSARRRAPLPTCSRRVWASGALQAT
jgi:hypothetical protein